MIERIKWVGSRISLDCSFDPLARFPVKHVKTQRTLKDMEFISTMNWNQTYIIIVCKWQGQKFPVLSSRGLCEHNAKAVLQVNVITTWVLKLYTQTSLCYHDINRFGLTMGYIQVSTSVNNSEYGDAKHSVAHDSVTKLRHGWFGRKFWERLPGLI